LTPDGNILENSGLGTGTQTVSKGFVRITGWEREYLGKLQAS
jgi:hypothetical protein